MSVLSFDPQTLWFRLSRSPRKWLARRIPAGVVVDIGCGDMTKSFAFVAAVNPRLTLVGVEKYEDATIYGESFVPEPLLQTGRVRRIACDFTQGPLPFAEGSVDGVFCSHVIEHVDDRAQLAQEIFRILRPGGFAYVETPGPGSLLAAKDSWMRKLAPECPFNYFDDPTHLAKPFDGDELRRLFVRAGFATARVGTHRDFGLIAMPLYLALLAMSRAPLVPRQIRGLFVRAGWWNAVGWPIYVLAEKPATVAMQQIPQAPNTLARATMPH